MTGETDSPGMDRIWASDFARMAAKEEADQMGLDYLAEAARSSEILQDISDSVKSGDLLVYVRFAGVGMIERKANASEPKFPTGDFPLKAASVRKWFRGEPANVPEIPSETSYRLPLFKRLEPVNPWRGGRITDIDVLGLPEAAAMASKHAGQPVTIQDILRAAARGEIPLRAVVRCSAKTVPCKSGDLPMNDGKPVPQGSIPTLPISACQALANTGRAEWRTFEWFADVPGSGGVDARFDRWQLAPGEPDFITTPDDCRVTGRDLHALADAFCQPTDTTPVQGVSVDSVTSRRRKKALIAELIAEWPSIENDLAESSRNGLKEAAHADKHGMWWLDKARQWAIDRGKLSRTPTTPPTPWPNPTTRHRI